MGTLLPFYLTKSRLRGDLLTLFFLNPGDSYYLRELERKLKVSPGALARELRTLSSEGILKKLPRGKQIFYQINSDHPLYNEVKGIIEKTSGIPRTFSDALKDLKEIQQAYLYGSVVTGKMDAGSDIDLVLVGKQSENVLKLLEELQARFGRSINAVTYAAKEFEQKRKNKSEFLYMVMKSPLTKLK